MCGLVLHVTCPEINIPAKHELYEEVSRPLLNSQKGQASETPGLLSPHPFGGKEIMDKSNHNLTTIAVLLQCPIPRPSCMCLPSLLSTFFHVSYVFPPPLPHTQTHVFSCASARSNQYHSV